MIQDEIAHSILAHEKRKVHAKTVLAGADYRSRWPYELQARL
jgi:hypothetical protein